MIWDNINEGRYRGRKALKRKGRLFPARVWEEYGFPWRKMGWSRDRVRNGLQREDWYKPKGAPTKRGNKRGQSKPR